MSTLLFRKGTPRNKEWEELWKRQGQIAKQIDSLYGEQQKIETKMEKIESKQVNK